MVVIMIWQVFQNERFLPQLDKSKLMTKAKRTLNVVCLMNRYSSGLEVQRPLIGGSQRVTLVVDSTFLPQNFGKVVGTYK